MSEYARTEHLPVPFALPAVYYGSRSCPPGSKTHSAVVDALKTVAEQHGYRFVAAGEFLVVRYGRPHHPYTVGYVCDTVEDRVWPVVWTTRGSAAWCPVDSWEFRDPPLMRPRPNVCAVCGEPVDGTPDMSGHADCVR